MDGARILTFGYNANWRGAGKAISSVTEFAKDLLYEMRFAKDEDGSNLELGSRPIIFIVHSMGGLVVKKAYLLGIHDDQYKGIIASISSMIFLSTPHRGSDWAEVLNKVISATFQSPKGFISDLNRNSVMLDELNEQFRHFVCNLSIWSFYETWATCIGHRKIMILEKDSSVLGYPSEISKPLQADHRGVCKYSSPNDSNYISVRNAIKSVVSTSLSNMGQKGTESSQAEEVAKLQALFCNCATTEDEYGILRRQWIPSTCTWFLQETEVVSWMEAAESSILWFNASPGAGKSVLAAFMIDHLRDSGERCQYFFFKHSERHRSSVASAWKAIAVQAAKDIPIFRKKLCTVSADSLGLDSDDPHLIWRNVFENTLKLSGDQRMLYWVIDGLDECDAPKLLPECLQSIARLSLPVKVLVLSRSTHSISVAFEKLSKFIPVKRVEVSGQTNADIETLINQEFTHMPGDEDFLRRLKEAMVTRSSGSFLWTKLVLDEILDCHTEESVQEMLDEISDDMFEVYWRMEENIIKATRKSNIPLIKAIIEWTICSHRTLSLQEMSEALRPEYSRIIDLSRTIKDICGHFIQISDQGKISLLHHTAREYFLRTTKSQFFVEEDKTNEKLFQKALFSLESPSLRLSMFQRQHALLATEPFVFYAAAHWSDHLMKCDVDSSTVRDRLIGFLRNPSALQWIHALSLLRRVDVILKTSKDITCFANRIHAHDAIKSPIPYRLSNLQLLDDWADDLPNLVGKFGHQLISAPDIIYEIVPALSPGMTAINRQYRGSTTLNIQVLGLEISHWNDSLGRLALPSATQAWKVGCAGTLLAVLGSKGTVHLWNTSSFLVAGSVHHGEMVTNMALNRAGSKLVTWGNKNTKVWHVPAGSLITTFVNPMSGNAKGITFADDDFTIIVCGQDGYIRFASLSQPAKGWRILHPNLLNETLLEGAYHGSPICLAFSPDNVYVGVSYKGAPLSVWSLSDGRCINRCKRARDWGTGKSRPTTNWFSANRFAWNPVTTHIVGIYKPGYIFKWHPVTDEISEARMVADEITVSPNGKLFATSSPNGYVRIWDFVNFHVIYQSYSNDVVSDLTFSPDSRRLYDVRGQVVNIWEPNSIGKFLEGERRPVEASYQTNSPLLVLKDSPQHVTAIGTSPDGLSYCAGYEDGRVLLFSSHHDQGVEVALFCNHLDITHICWSPEGRYIAVADLSGLVQIKSIEWKADGVVVTEPLPEIDHDLEESIGDMVFNDDGSALMIVPNRSNQVCIVEVHSAQITYHHVSEQNRKWFRYPEDSSAFLTLGTDAQVYTWEAGNLERAAQINFEWPRTATSADKRFAGLQVSTVSHLASHSDTDPDEYMFKEGWYCQDKKHILLEVRHSSFSQLTGEKTLVIMQADKLQKSGDISIRLVDIPTDVSKEVLRPLGIMPGSRLIFLDQSLWICSYLLKEPHASSELYHRHYFIPRDWVGRHSLEGCVMGGDGMLYWPKEELVVRIRCDFDLAKSILVS